VKAASDAYRRIQQGDHSLYVEEGHALLKKSPLVNWITRPDLRIAFSAIFGLAAAVAGFSLELGGDHSSLLRALCGTVFALAGVGALCVLFSTLPHLLRDLDQIESYLDQLLSTGDLTSSFNFNQRGRAARIARKLGLFVGWVQATVQCIQDAVAPVEQGTEEIRQAILGIDEAATAQNMSTASVAAASTELDLTIREVSEHLQSTEAAVQETGRRASEGAQVSHRATEQIQELAKGIQSASVEVEALGTSTAEVGAIAGVIRSIADQTNLLALNASIEAARAGEAGRGFAVVANEVRSLADRTTKATAEIDALISTITGDSDRAITGMRTGATQVTNGVELVREAQQALSGINSLMTEAVQRVTEIATASSQQTEAMGEITSNITHVAAMTEQNLGVVKHTTQLIGGLAPMVDRVRQAVKQYHV